MDRGGPPDQRNAHEARIEATSSKGSLRLRLSGAWRFRDGIPDVRQTCERIAGERLRRVEFDATGIAAWDSGLLVYLRRVEACCREHGAELDLSGLPDGVRTLIRMAAARVGPPEGLGDRRARHPAIARIGMATHRALDETRAMVEFSGEAILSFGRLLRGKAQFRPVDLLLLVHETGSAALPIVTLIGVLVGTILSFLGSVQLRMFGAEIYVANLVSIGMTREMGALMTGIIMAGRTGASFAAQLGTMQVNEEIDALKTMGFSPMDFLVLPRMLALILMMPLLTIYADFMGMVGGTIVGVTMLDLTPMQYYTQASTKLGLDDIAAGLVKSAVYGVAVAVAGCMRGIRCGRSASAVGDATTAAVVSGIVAIIVWDSVLSIVFIQTGF